MRDPKKWEKLESGVYLRRPGVPYTAAEEAEFYGKGELKAFTRRPRPEDPSPPSDPQ